jgi:TfoX/Sxy family transcriptional regulator of competence genes
MAYNERIAERVRQLLSGRRGVSERKMFGGIAFLLDGKMCVGVVNDDLMVRSGPDRHVEALHKPHTRPMDFTGRPMTGMVFVEPAGIARGPSLRRWVDLGIAAAEAATPSRSRARKRRADVLRP